MFTLPGTKELCDNTYDIFPKHIHWVDAFMKSNATTQYCSGGIHFPFQFRVISPTAEGGRVVAKQWQRLRGPVAQQEVTTVAPAAVTLRNDFRV